jgi:hypothetical protein
MQHAVAEFGQVRDLTRAGFEEGTAQSGWQRGEQRAHLRLGQRDRGRLLGLSMWQTIRRLISASRALRAVIGQRLGS